MTQYIQEEFQPSEHTLSIIKQIAYTYRVMKTPGCNVSYSLN